MSQGNTGVGHEDVPTREVVAKGVRNAFNAYLRAFHTQLAKSVLPYINVPLTVAVGGEVHLLTRFDEVEAMYARMLKKLAKVGYLHTVMASLDVIVLDETMALLQVDGTRYDRFERALERIEACYTYVLQEGSWKIAVMMPFTSIE